MSYQGMETQTGFVGAVNVAVAAVVGVGADVALLK